MAYENPLGTNFLAIFEMATGLRQYQAVALNSTGLLVNPTTLGQTIGVLVSSGSTSSTASGRLGSVQVYGVTKMLQGSTTITQGAYVEASTQGLAVAHTETGNDIIGTLLTGSDSTGVAGTTDDEFGIVSVLLQYIGKNSTVA